MCNRVTSLRIWLFTMHRWSWVKRGYKPHLSPLKNSWSPPKGSPVSPLDNTATLERPSRLPFTPQHVNFCLLVSVSPVSFIFCCLNQTSYRFKTKTVLLEVTRKESSENAKNQPHILASRTRSASTALHCGNLRCRMSLGEIFRLSPVVFIFVKN